MRFIRGQVRTDEKCNALKYSWATVLYSKEKWGRGKVLSFLNRHHASIISSSSRLSGGVFLSLRGQAGPQIIVFYVCREHVLGIFNFLSSLGRIWGSCCHFGGMSPVLLLHDFVAKQACLVSCKSFLSNH